MSLKWRTSPYRTVTNRLALQFLVAFSVLGVISFSAFNVLLGRWLGAEMDEELRADGAEMAAIYEQDGATALATSFAREAASDGVDRVIFALVGSGGDLRAHAGLPLWEGWEAPASTDVGEVRLQSVGAADGDTLRVASLRLADGSCLVVGQTNAEVTELLWVFQATFAAWLVLVLAIGSALGWLVARNAMAGVRRVTLTANSVSAGELSRRVPVGDEGREIEVLAESFNAMLGRIEGLVAELQQVTHDVAHDLRTPLTRMRAVSELALRDRTATAEQQDFAVSIIEECDRLVAMINTSLEIAETQAKTSALTLEPADLAALLRDLVDLCLPLAEDGGVRLTCATPDGPVMVPMERARIQRAVGNVLDNALKYTPTSGEVTVTLAIQEDAACVTIVDTGIGIDGGDLPRVFDRFFRSEKSRHAVGNGLGLSLARAIAEAHGGSIEIRSQLGAGTTVTLRLPLGQREIPAKMMER